MRDVGAALREYLVGAPARREAAALERVVQAAKVVADPLNATLLFASGGRGVGELQRALRELAIVRREYIGAGTP